MLSPSQQGVIDQFAASLTRQSSSSRKRLYASRVLRMGALTMATGVPIAIAVHRDKMGLFPSIPSVQGLPAVTLALGIKTPEVQIRRSARCRMT